jgi:hypothetical protein
VLSFRILPGHFTNVIGKFRMSDDLHPLWASARLPEFIFGRALDLTGFEILKALHRFLISDVVRTGIELLEERRNQFCAITQIEFGSFFEQLCDL